LPGRFLVGTEVVECDDAAALARRCGDGAIDNASVEECDDGDRIDTNLCNNGCRLADCGDGLIQAPEECDPPDSCLGTGPCSAQCLGCFLVGQAEN